MKTSVLTLFLSLCFAFSFSQPADPKRSSKTAAQYDAACISANIGYDKDMMYFGRLGADRGSTADTKEVANETITDFTEILYAVEQLETSGGGKGTQAKVTEQAAALNEALSSLRGFNFDTLWLGGVLRMHQAKLIDLTEQKAMVTDSRLKQAVTEAIPVVRRHITKLNSLQKQLIKKDLQEKKEAAKQQQLLEKQKKKKK